MKPGGGDSMKRPIVFTSLCYIAGVVCFFYLKSYVLIIMSVGVLLGLIYYKRTYRYIFAYGIIGIVLLLTGFYKSYSIDDSIKKIQKSLSDDMPLTVLVQDVELSDSGNIVFGKVLYNQNVKIPPLITFKVLVYSKGHITPKVGDIIQVKGEIKYFEKARNPGGFDSISYYYPRKIYNSIYADEIQIQSSNNSHFLRIISLVQKSLSRQIHIILPQKQAGIMDLMLLGKNDSIDKTTIQYYQIAGISHILSISGLHMMIIGMGIYKFLRKICHNIRISIILSTLFICAYCALVGSNVAALRSCLMFIILLIADGLGEKYDPWTSVTMVAAILLMDHPYQIKDVGFLLSFFAVLGMMSLAPVMNLMWNPFYSKLLEAIYTSLGATLATLPIVVWYFYQIPTYVLLVNLLIIPCSSLILGLGLFSVLVAYLSKLLAKLLAGAVYFSLQYIELCCVLVTHLPMNQIPIKRPGIISIIVYYLLMCLWLFKNKIKLKPICGYVIVISIVIMSLFYQISERQKLKITFLDVGQGDSIVIEYSGKVFIVDGGGEVGKKSEKNTGTYDLLPFLKAMGITHVDGIFITHSDFDHIYGIIEIMPNITVDFIALPEVYREKQDSLLEQFLESAKESNTPIYYFEQGDKYQYKELCITCLSPLKEPKYYKNNNEISLVLLLSFKDFDALLTGDIEAEGELGLINTKQLKEIELIKVAHHGSNTSSTKEFIETLNPEVGVISVGINNFYGHPSKSVLERFEDLGTKVFCTSEHGAIFIEVKDDTFKVSTYFTKRRAVYPCKN